MGSQVSMPGNGLAKPLGELERMWPREILVMDIASQAELADAVCRSGAADAAISAGFLKDMSSSFPHEPPNNTTGVGNCAYMALYAVDPGHRAQFAIIHKSYTLMLKRQYNVRMCSTQLASALAFYRFDGFE